MDNVNKTLYIPLYGKAYVSKKCILLDDKKAEEIWDAEAFPLKGKSRSKWLAYYMGMRSAVFDQWLRQQLCDTQDTVIIHIGCGMDSRVLRVGAANCKWYDVDFAEVIEERKRYYTEDANYQMLACDVRDSGWLESIPESKKAIVLMEGVSMYLSLQELKGLSEKLCTHFEQLSLLMDSYTVLAAKLSKYKNPINDVGVTQVYGIDDLKALENTEISFVKEHEMTPQELIDELCGMEKYIFKKVFAGSFSKKMYRLCEYRKY